MSGVCRQDAETALDAGWSQGQLLYLHDEACEAGIDCHLVAPWGFLVGGVRLVYRRAQYSGQNQLQLFSRIGRPATAYCDGSGTTGDKTAGIGVAAYQGGAEPRLIAENIGPGTNNRAELCAIWRALREFPDVSQTILIKTDSEYAIGSLTKDWVRNANADLIENIRVDLAYRSGFVEFEHVDGHSGVEGNEVADRLANIGRKLVTRVSEYEG